jgi:hypothetical protein
MKNNKKIFLSIYICICFTLLTVYAVAAETEGFLSGKHIKNGINCEDCHSGEKEPKTNADVQPCLDCHGGYAGMAEATETLEVNPHASHEGELPCSECHKSHTPSIDYCEQCHTFSFKVP